MVGKATRAGQLADLREQLQATLGDSLILEQELGGGGMSRVFVAQDPALGRKVVIKVLPPELAVSIDRFRREIHLAAQLQHPHIVPLLSAGETNGLPYYTMPFVRGESLRERLSKGELPVSEAVHILREIATALAHAHEAGVVHRDIKPANVLMSGGSAVVTDFGVAKAITMSSGDFRSGLTSTDVAIGTPAYMAPEQATADPNIDYRADIYSLGIVAYEMLSGSTPFPARSPQATLLAQVSEQPVPIQHLRPAIPGQLSALVMRCLEKHSADRPQSAKDVIHEIDALTTPKVGVERTYTKTRALTISKEWAAIVAVAVVVVSFAAFALSRKTDDRSSSVVTETPSIAVLPFDNLGRKEGQEFTDGMTEEITNRLASLRGLRVIGRQSANNYAGTRKTPKQIAAELGVKYVLTGTVRWDRSTDGKDMVRVSPALLRTDDATEIWSHPYESVLAGMFDIQAQVASEVASALDVTLLAPEKDALQRKLTSNVRAYAFYLRGNDRLESTAEPIEIQEAIDLLEKATAEDPEFAVGFAKLGIAHVELYRYEGDLKQSRLASAKKAIDKAFALEPGLPEAHEALAVYYYHGFREFDKALGELDKMEAQQPNNPDVLNWKGVIYRRQGKWNLALSAQKRLIDLEPRNSLYLDELANTYRFLRRYDEMELVADRLMITSPSYAGGPSKKALAAIYRRQNIDEAVGYLRDAVGKITPRGALADLILNNVWIALRDSALKRRAIAFSYTPDLGRKSFYMLQKARLYYHLGDSSRVRAYADSGIRTARSDLQSNWNRVLLYQDLGHLYAYLGERELSLRALDSAESLAPPSGDAYAAPGILLTRVVALVILGDPDSAIPIIERLLGMPGGLDRSWLRLNPSFDKLRTDPRFQALIQ